MESGKGDLTLTEQQKYKGDQLRDNIQHMMLEPLADLCHNQWSGWMEYLFSRCEENEDGSVIIPKEAVDRWKRQMATEYESLSTEEQESDRKEAHKFIDFMRTMGFVDSIHYSEWYKKRHGNF